MNVLVIRNLPFPSKSTVETFLINKNIPHTLIQPLQGDNIPDTRPYDTLVILGGLMGAYEGDQYSFINEEIKLAKDFILSEKKTLGLCLGAQIMASSLGAKVYKGNNKEIGWCNLKIEDHILYDDRIKLISKDTKTEKQEKVMKVLNWHGDTFDLPDNVELLGSTNQYKHQGFKYKDNAYALQFHLEVTEEMINDWIKATKIDPTIIKKETQTYLTEFQERANAFYKSFFEV